MAVQELSDRFFKSTDDDAVAVVDQAGTPVGLVTRNKLLSLLFRRFGWEIYGRKSVIAVTDTNALSVSEDTSLDEALRLAMARPQDDAYDDLLVVDIESRFVGLLSVRQMVIRHGHALANVLLQRNLADARAAEMERITGLKSQFLAHVTHELRSPVNAIIELAELIRIATEKGFVAQINDRLTLLLSSATSLRSVITNILDLSKIEAGRMTLFIEPFDLRSVADDAVETTRVLLGSKPVTVTMGELAGPLTIESDSVKCRQVLTNLLSNAAKFTDAGSITVRLSSDADAAMITVSDTGIGIRADDLDRLFAPFSQLEDARTKMHQGTGLGLAITRNLVQLLGGEISVSSEFGKGTQFTVRLPLTAPAREAA